MDVQFGFFGMALSQFSKMGQKYKTGSRISYDDMDIFVSVRFSDKKIYAIHHIDKEN